MEGGKGNEGQTEGEEENKSLVSSIVLREDIVNLQDLIERLIIEREGPIHKRPFRQRPVQTYLRRATLKLISVSTIFHLYYSFSEEMRVKEISKVIKSHDVSCLLDHIKSYFSYAETSRVTMAEGHLVELLDAILMYLQYLPKCRSALTFLSTTQFELLQNVFGNLRDFHRLKVNGSVEYEAVEYVLPQIQLMAQKVVNFCFTLLDYLLAESKESHVSQVNSKLAKLLVEVICVELEVMHICCTNLKDPKSEEVGRFIEQLREASPNILRESLIHLQEHMFDVITPSSSASDIHVMIEFLLIILTDVPKDVIHHDKLFVLLVRVGELTKEVFVLVCNLEENMNATSGAGINFLENIEILKEDLKTVFLKAPADSSQLCFPMTDGPLFMNLLLRNLNDLLNSNAYSVALIKEEIRQVKELITSFSGKVEQELNRDLWARVLDVAYAAEHAINSIIVRDHGLLQLIYFLPDIVDEIKLLKKEVQETISKNTSIIFANSPNKPVENKSPPTGKLFVGFEEETKWIIKKLTSRPAEIDVISIIFLHCVPFRFIFFRITS